MTQATVSASERKPITTIDSIITTPRSLLLAVFFLVMVRLSMDERRLVLGIDDMVPHPLSPGVSVQVVNDEILLLLEDRVHDTGSPVDTVEDAVERRAAGQEIRLDAELANRLLDG